MNGKQIIPFYSLKQSASVSHGATFSLGLFKGAPRICRCSCFCLAKPSTVCLQTFRCATRKIEIPKKICPWNPSVKKAKAGACNTSGNGGAASGERLLHACATCRGRSARQSAGGQGPWGLFGCSSPAGPSESLQLSALASPFKNKEVIILISWESSFL